MCVAVELVPGPWNLTSPKGLVSRLRYPLPRSNMFCNGRGKKCSLVANVKGPWQTNIFIFLFFVLCQTFPWFCEKNKGECQTWRKFQPSLCGTNIQKNKPIHIMVYGHFSWSMFGLHRVKGPKALIFSFFYKSNHEVWLWQNDIWHQTNSWSIINNPLLNKKFGIHVSSLLCVGGGGFGVSLHRWSKNVISNKIK